MADDEAEREPCPKGCTCDECFDKIRRASKEAMRDDMESDPDAPSAEDLARMFKPF